MIAGISSSWWRSSRRAVTTLSVIVLVLTSLSTPALAENENVTEAGDYMQILLPTIAFTSTLLAGNDEGGMWDKEGSKQFGFSFGSAVVTTQVWKEIAQKLRPHGGNNASFPSGHSTAAFSGAAFINTRYGALYGIPAYAGALFVGYSRVQADAHYPDDVLAGASVALMYNWLWVTPQPRRVALLPVLYADGVGVNLVVSDAGTRYGKSDSDRGGSSSRRTRPGYRYDFAFGPAYLKVNEVSSPAATGTTFDLKDFEGINDPTTTAVVDFTFFVGENGMIDILLSPFEARDQGLFSYDVNFAGQSFPAYTPLKSSWVMHNLSVGYSHDLTPDSPWIAEVGAGLFYEWLQVELAEASGANEAKVKDEVVLPYLHTVLGYQVTPKWSILLGADGTYLQEDSMINAGPYVNYRITENWEASGGYMVYGRDITTSELSNKVRYDVPWLSVSYQW